MELSEFEARLERARAGDAEVLGDLFAAMADPLDFFVRARMGAKLRAQLDSTDVLQETFLHAYRKFDGFRGSCAAELSRWLHRIAENVVRDSADHLGAQKRGGSERPVELESVLDRCRASQTGPFTQLVRASWRESLLTELEVMDPEQVRVVLARFFIGSTIDEIANETGTSATSVRRQLARALQSIGGKLRRFDERSEVHEPGGDDE